LSRRQPYRKLGNDGQTKAISRDINNLSASHAATLVPLLRALEEAIQQSDPVTVGSSLQVLKAGTNGAVWSDEIRQMEEQIADFHFDQAQKILTEMTKDLEIALPRPSERFFIPIRRKRERPFRSAHSA
jgi:hypothetical protein